MKVHGTTKAAVLEWGVGFLNLFISNIYDTYPVHYLAWENNNRSGL